MSARTRRLPLLAYVIVALLCAAALVVYLQHRALTALDRQTGLIVQKIAEQTAFRVSQELRATFDGPVFDTLTAINHPVLRTGDLAPVAAIFESGLQNYPQVERFFLWHEHTHATAPGEVLFFGRKAAARPVVPTAPHFFREPHLGRLVLEYARRDAQTQRIYSVHHIHDPDGTRDVFIRVFYTDAERSSYFAVLGFTVNLVQVRTNLFPELVRTKLRPMLDPPEETPRFDLRVFDEQGAMVWGPPGKPSEFSGRAPVSLLFYPAEAIETRMAAALPDRRWTLTLSPQSRDARLSFATSETQGYWLSGLSVLLMLVALALVIHGQRQNEQLARMQREFVANASHQLKTPLSLLTAVTETLTLERVRSPEKFTQYLDILRTETSRLSGLVARILEFAQAEGGTRKYEFEGVDLAYLASEVVGALNKGLGRSGVTLRIDAPTPGPTVVGDPAALEQVLLNLIDNAVKYSADRKEVTVRVSFTDVDAVLEVADRGCGVSVGDRARIFDRFYRGSCTGKHPQGFGLGLAIVREILRAHRGRIEVHPNPGGGSIFRVSLPLRDRQREIAGRRLTWPAAARVK